MMITDKKFESAFRECCGNCKSTYLLSENGKVRVICNADYIPLPDGGHRMTNKRVRWDDAPCSLYERREEEEIDASD